MITAYIRTIGGSWVNLKTTYGISFSDGTISRLLTPAPNKEIVENKSDIQHGKSVDRDPTYVFKDERTFSLEMHLTAKNATDFLLKYNAFCTQILDKGFFDIRLEEIPNIYIRLTYLDCTQFTEFNFGLAKFTLSVNEPDPTNRVPD